MPFACVVCFISHTVGLHRTGANNNNNNNHNNNNNNAYQFVVFEDVFFRKGFIVSARTLQFQYQSY